MNYISIYIFSNVVICIITCISPYRDAHRRERVDKGRDIRKQKKMVVGKHLSEFRIGR